MLSWVARFAELIDVGLLKCRLDVWTRHENHIDLRLDKHVLLQAANIRRRMVLSEINLN